MKILKVPKLGEKCFLARLLTNKNSSKLTKFEVKSPLPLHKMSSNFPFIISSNSMYKSAYFVASAWVICEYVKMNPIRMVQYLAVSEHFLFEFT